MSAPIRDGFVTSAIRTDAGLVGHDIICVRMIVLGALVVEAHVELVLGVRLHMEFQVLAAKGAHLQLPEL